MVDATPQPDALPAPYDAIADAWHRTPRAFTAQPYLERLLARLPAGATVLDLGCGTGLPIGRAILDRGCRLVGIDRSAAMLRIARRELPQAHLILADLRAPGLDGAFDAAVVWDALFHLPRTQHHQVFESLARLLRPGAPLLLSAGGSEAESFTSDMYGHSFGYSGWDPAGTCARLACAGFAIQLCEIDDPSSRGHVAILATRTKG